RKSALQLGIAKAVETAALLDPLQATQRIGILVGVVLLEAGVHAGLAGGLVGIFLGDRRREFHASWRLGRRCRRLAVIFRLGRVRGRIVVCSVGAALGFAEVVPL